MSRPNIVLICADDLDFSEMECYRGLGLPGATPFGDAAVHTPHIDSLARDGTLLTRYYATSAICTPSRYSILTGRLASRSPSILADFPPPAQATITWNARVSRDGDSMAKALRAMGYATAFVGKWHAGAPKPDFSAVAPDADPHDPAVATVAREQWQIGVDHLRDGLGFDVVDRVYFGNKEYLPPRLQVHNLEWIAEGATAFIDAHRDEPFFLHMALTTPHGDQHTDFLSADPLLTPAGPLERRPTVMPPRESIPDRLRAAGVDPATAMATWIDDAVGAVLGRLDALGLADNTIVIFTGDHLGRGKYMCYEGSRVPLIARWPGRIPTGGTSAALAANIDLAATLAELAGDPLPDDYDTDGVSFADVLLRPDHAAGREHVFLEVSNIRGVVTDRWKYIACRASEQVLAAMAADAEAARREGRKRLVGWDGRVNPHAHALSEGIRYFADGAFPHYLDADQLYDLAADPWERHNVIDDPANADVLADMKRRLAEELARLPHNFGEFTA